MDIDVGCAKACPGNLYQWNIFVLTLSRHQEVGISANNLAFDFCTCSGGVLEPGALVHAVVEVYSVVIKQIYIIKNESILRKYKLHE